MSVGWLTFRDLEYIVALGKHLHFAKAAEEVHVSQPALSTQLKKIEDQLGVLLFERSNRRVSLTEVGGRVVGAAGKLLDDGRRLVQEIAKPSAPLSGTVSIGAIATLGPFLIPLVLPKLRKKYPATQFVFREGLTAELLTSLKRGEIDYVLAADTFSDPSFTVQSIFFEPFVLAVARGHEFATKNPIVLKDLHPEEMVLLEDGHCLKDQTIQLCSKRSGKAPKSFQATSVETLRHLVASGLGYTLLPKLAVRKDDSLSKLLAYRNLPNSAGREIVLVTRKEFSRPKDVTELLEFLRVNRPTWRD